MKHKLFAFVGRVLLRRRSRSRQKGEEKERDRGRSTHSSGGNGATCVVVATLLSGPAAHQSKINRHQVL